MADLRPDDRRASNNHQQRSYFYTFLDDNFTETKARINIYAGAFKNRSKPKTDNQLGNQAGQYFANPGAVLG